MHAYSEFVQPEFVSAIVPFGFLNKCDL